MCNSQTLCILTPLFTFIESCSAYAILFLFSLLDTCITFVAFEVSDQSVSIFYINLEMSVCYEVYT